MVPRVEEQARVLVVQCTAGGFHTSMCMHDCVLKEDRQMVVVGDGDNFRRRSGAWKNLSDVRLHMEKSSAHT